MNDEPVPPGIDSPLADVPMPPNPPPSNDSPKIQTSAKGVEIAKKRLRAFSIQKKNPVIPPAVASPSPQPTASPGVVVIGKLASVKVPIIPKFPPTAPIVTLVEDIEDKKKKPPKPGSVDTYMDLKKRTLSEIEDMKRKMELVELGIPLGLIGPTSSSPAAKVMPTKAMPPIKSFLTTQQLDEIIMEAKKAKAEGREFKFDYQKLLPAYENPFQRKYKATEEEKEKEFEMEKEKFYERKERERDMHKGRSGRSRSHVDKRKSERYDRRHEKDRDRKDSREHRDRKRDKDKSGDRDKKDVGKKERDAKSKDRDEKTKDAKVKDSKDKVKREKSETDVNLKDFVVCDSWSLDNDDKNDTLSPKVDLKTNKNAKSEKGKITEDKLQEIKERMEREKQGIIEKRLKNKNSKPKMEKLQPVNDSFNFEIDEDAVLDIFDEDSDLEKFSKVKSKTEMLKSDQDSQDTKDSNEDFLESVINEIKQEDLSDDASQDKGLVEYEMSPDKSDGTPDVSLSVRSGSVTPELSDIMRSSQRSDYSDFKSEESGIRSTESGFKSTESGFKSSESGFKSSESFRVADTPDSLRSVDDLPRQMVDSLETWSFVMKICQPLLFRHDRNKCYRETKTLPTLWFTTNPRRCGCVRDRAVVWGELRQLQGALLDQLHGWAAISPHPPPTSRPWYPSDPLSFSPPKSPPETSNVSSEGSLGVSRATEWESEDEPSTPRRKPEMSLDQEYQRFMDAVWPEISETKKEPRGTPPIKEEKRKKKKLAVDGEKKREAKKIKLASESWSQESDVEEEKSVKKQKVTKKDKSRKRKRSSSTLTETSEEEGGEKKLKKKSLKKKNMKKKAKLAKRRRLEKKYMLKLKGKNKKKIKKTKDKSDKSTEIESEDEKEKSKKAKKKKKLKQKKKEQKKKRTKSTSSSSDSESSDAEEEKRKKKEDKKKKKKRASSESHSDELFDVNVLNNIKTEKVEFSPRRQQNKQREIISMEDLQTDWETKNLQIKQEVEEKEKEDVEEKDVSVESVKSAEMLEEALEKSQIEINPTPPEESPPSPPPKPPSPPPSRPGSPLEGYDMYEQLAMEYQSGVKSQQLTAPPSVEPATQQRIETVVSRLPRGEIKCDWRAGDAVAPGPARPSRWGLKPGEANIVLTGKSADADTFRIRSVLEDDDFDDAMNYDQAYRAMYGAMDRAQYGDCFAREDRLSLDDRIKTVLEEQSKDKLVEINSGEKQNQFDTKLEAVKAVKRVSFADGYRPGQDSDCEEPPVKRKRRRRAGCAWPCPAAHPDHVPLWDALPPPPPPPSPPPPAPPPMRLLQRPPQPPLLAAPTAMQLGIKFDSNSIPGMLPEPPPGMMSLPHGPM